jgi:putative Mg2+ transporter-C (MgtC) family protein
MEEIWNAFLSEDIGLPMLSSLVTGMLIGFEREVRSKPAGLRTHTLICFASTLLMLAAARQAEWFIEFIPEGQIVTDPTRMAHGVLTGIGFLCAGVIFREGASIHGLTTAASLWVSAAIGVLYGIGMYWLAVSGAIATLVVLVILRLLNVLLPCRVEARLKVVAAAGTGFDAPALRRLLDDGGASGDTISHALVEDGRLQFATRAKFADEAAIARLSEVLRGAPGVLAFSIVPTEDDPEFYRPVRA